jgi:hypothetical protein
MARRRDFGRVVSHFSWVKTRFRRFACLRVNSATTSGRRTPNKRTADSSSLLEKRSGLARNETRNASLQIGRERIAPEVVGEPVVIFLGDGALLLGLGDGMAEAFVEDELNGHAAIFESTIKLP